MKKSFFCPILFLGIMTLLGGHVGMFENFKKMETTEIGLENFINRYQNGNDYNALFDKALEIYEEANVLQSEYTAFSASVATLGLFLVMFAFDRRRMFKKYKELNQQLEDSIPNQAVPEGLHTSNPESKN